MFYSSRKSKTILPSLRKPRKRKLTLMKSKMIYMAAVLMMRSKRPKKISQTSKNSNRRK
jgi:hypothetical protein